MWDELHSLLFSTVNYGTVGDFFFMNQSFAEQSLSQKLLLSYRSAAHNPKVKWNIPTSLSDR